MPYITQEERDHLDAGGTTTSIGQVNYVITKACLRYLYGSNGDIKPSYDRFNAVIGVLECAKQELYRRHIVPYEEYKIAVNGDIERK